MRESAIESYLVARVEQCGGVTAKMTVAGRRGWPDRLVVMRGWVGLVELKRPRGGTLSIAQKMLFDQLAALGLPVTRIKTRQEVEQFINSHGHLKPGSNHEGD